MWRHRSLAHHGKACSWHPPATDDKMPCQDVCQRVRYREGSKYIDMSFPLRKWSKCFAQRFSVRLGVCKATEMTWTKISRYSAKIDGVSGNRNSDMNPSLVCGRALMNDLSSVCHASSDSCTTQVVFLAVVRFLTWLGEPVKVCQWPSAPRCYSTDISRDYGAVVWTSEGFSSN